MLIPHMQTLNHKHCGARHFTRTLCSGQFVEGGRHRSGVGKTQPISAGIGRGVEAGVRTMCATKNQSVDAQFSTARPIDLIVPHKCSAQVNSSNAVRKGCK